MREEQDGVLASDEMLVRKRLEFAQGNVWRQFVVERIERPPEAFAELLEQKFRLAEAAENQVRRPGHRAGIVGQCPGPIEDQVAQHPG